MQVWSWGSSGIPGSPQGPSNNGPSEKGQVRSISAGFRTLSVLRVLPGRA
jgi:hypothetical protein